MRAPILVDNVEDLGALNAMLCAFTCTEVLRSIVERQGATQLSYMNLAAWKTFVVPESHPARDCRVYSPPRGTTEEEHVSCSNAARPPISALHLAACVKVMMAAHATTAPARFHHELAYFFF